MMETKVKPSTRSWLLELVKAKEEKLAPKSVNRSRGVDLREFIEDLKTASAGQTMIEEDLPAFAPPEKVSFPEEPPELASFELMDVVIQEIYSPSKFYFWLAKDAPKADHLMARLGEFYASSVNQAHYKVPSVYEDWTGLACAVLFQNIWYRAIIRSHHRGEEQVLVFLVDYGSLDWVLESQVCLIEPEFAQLPPFAVEAKLSGCPDHVDWEPEECEFFFATLWDCQVNHSIKNYYTATAYVESVQDHVAVLEIFTDDFKWLGDKMSLLAKSQFSMNLEEISESGKLPDFEHIMIMQQTVKDKTLKLARKSSYLDHEVFKRLLKTQLWSAVLQSKLYSY